MYRIIRDKRIVYSFMLISFIILAVCYEMLKMDVSVDAANVELVEGGNVESIDVEQELTIFPQEPFFKEDLIITINSEDENVPIYYTLDGSIPTTDSLYYENPLKYEVSPELQVVVVRASSLVNGEMSKPVTQTYFVGEKVDERFSTQVISITTDETNLYDYETGIFVEGKTYDDWLAAGGDPEAPKYAAQTNYNQRSDEWVRDAHVEVFTKNGKELVDIDAGISVAGSASATYSIKSINVEADERFDTQTKYFNFVEAESYLSREKNNFYNVGETTNSVRLRNGGNDFTSTLIRQSVCNELALQSGLNTASIITPVVVYINGEYYSLLQAQNNFSRSNLGKMMSLETDNIIKLGEGEREIFAQVNSEIDFSTADFNDPNIRSEFEKIVDVDEFILYNAIQILIDNGDWPENNVKAVRYTGEYLEGNPYSEGKLHPLFFGSEFAFRLYSDEIDMFEIMFNPNLENEKARNKAYIIKNMMNYGPYKQKFVNKVCDLLATSFDPDNVVSLFDKYLDMIREELPYLMELENEVLRENGEKIERRVEDIKTPTYERMKWLIPIYLGEYFGASDPYQVYASIPNGGGTILCNTVDVAKAPEGTFTGTYYQNYPIQITAEAEDGRTFSHFIINGEEYDGESFTVSADLLIDNEIYVEAYFDETVGETPFITSASADGTQDWIELTNRYTNDISLSGLYISDDKNELRKCPCPDVTLSQADSIRIIGRKNTDSSEYRLSFALREMETIYLSNGKGEIMDFYFIPRE